MFLVLLLARINAFRDESGWQSHLVRRAFADGVEAARELGKRLAEVPAGQRARDIAKILFAAGLFLGAAANVVALFDAPTSDLPRFIAVTLFGIAAIVWLSGWRALVVQSRALGLSVDVAAVPILERAVFDLPPLIDCRNSDAPALVAQVNQRLLRRFFEELATWKPGILDAEREHETKLFRRLERRLPASFPKRQQKIESQGLGGRIDLMLAQHIGIEMKVRLDNTSADRMAGQVRRYARILKGRAPIILLLCQTDREFAVLRVTPEVESLRAEGCAIVAVLAN